MERRTEGEKTSSKEPTECVAPGRQTRRAHRRWPTRAAGNPPCAQKHLSVAGRVALPDAISRGRRWAPQYRAAIDRQNDRARTSRRKTRLRAADTQDPEANQQVRIVAPWP